MKRLNFLVLRVSILPLVSGVYKFQVLVSFPSPHLRVLTRGPHQQGVVGGSSERWFCFQYSCWLVDQFPKMIWRCSLTSKSPTECTDFCRFLTIYSPFYGSRLYFGKGQGYLWKKMPQNVKKSSIWSPFLLEDWMTLLWGGQNFSRVYFLCPFCVKNVLWDTYFLLEQADQFLSRLRAICARILDWSKTVFPTCTVFKKMPWKWKCCFQYSQMT